ncbi:MAG: DNA repair protein RadC [Clostridia bacterium]|jgi:DNA repair protein RadC|nr:DNA repair protein RadC [Clostridia bacterium]
MRIKEIPETERPYEKLEKYGAEYLSNSELLGIILKTGSKKMRVTELSSYLINRAGSFSALFQMSSSELTKINGIGRVKSIQIQAVEEIIKRVSKEEGKKKFKVNSPESIAKIYMEEMRRLKQERILIISLNTKYDIIKEDVVTVGILNEAIVHEREVFRRAIEASAYAIIMIHNHPSGDPTPSEEDIKLTRKISMAGDVLNIELLDHLIIGDNKYVSFKNKGLL